MRRLRLGWIYGPADIIDALNRIRGPFNVNAPAIAAGIASIGDSAHLEKARTHNEQWRPWLTEELGKVGIKVTPSVANFLLLHFPETPGKTAAEADALLTSRGVIVRAVRAYKLPNCLRTTVGTEEANVSSWSRRSPNEQRGDRGKWTPDPQAGVGGCLVCFCKAGLLEHVVDRK